MPGQEWGNAVADVLFNRVGPTARLPVSMPNGENDLGFSVPQEYPGAGGNCSCSLQRGQAPDCRGRKSPGCSAPGVVSDLPCNVRREGG